MDGERVVSFWRDLASIVDTSGTCTILFIPYSIEYRGRGCEFLSSWWMIRITRICCFYCCRGCCNDDSKIFIFKIERFEIRFEVNQLIEEKLTRGGKKKEEEKACPFDRTPPSRSLLPSRALVHVSDSGNVIEGREETPPCHRGLCKYVCSTIR